jgi:hypothetical protein
MCICAVMRDLERDPGVDAEDEDCELEVDIDAETVGNESRFINDSKGTGKPANIKFRRYYDAETGELRVKVLAKTDIQPKEEVRRCAARTLIDCAAVARVTRCCAVCNSPASHPHSCWSIMAMTFGITSVTVRKAGAMRTMTMRTIAAESEVPPSLMLLPRGCQRCPPNISYASQRCCVCCAVIIDLIERNKRPFLLNTAAGSCAQRHTSVWRQIAAAGIFHSSTGINSNG